MTPAQLDTIAAEAAGGCSTCVELVAEVRRLTAELQQAGLYCDDTRKATTIDLLDELVQVSAVCSKLFELIQAGAR